MGTRFWEFYLVRYLLGTIFAIVILFYLVINYNNEITKSFLFTASQKTNNLEDKDTIRSNISSLLFDVTYSIKKKDLIIFFPNQPTDESEMRVIENGFSVLAATIIAVSGFLYMYFSSMLILVLHGLRSTFFNYIIQKVKQKELNEIDNKIISHSMWIGILFFVFGVFFLFVRSASIHIFTIIFILFFILVIYLNYFKVQIFYKNLSLFRSKNNKCKNSSTEKKEYIESYKHLREHGNAFGIIVCEIIFAGWLILWDFSFWAIFYWCLIGFSSWILGSYLEIRGVESFVENVKNNSKSDL